MTAIRRTISIPEELHKRLERYRDDINISRVCAEALEQRITVVESAYDGPYTTPQTDPTYIVLTQPRCECDGRAAVLPLLASWYSTDERAAWGHLPGQCPRTTSLARYRRDGRLVWLCSACNLSNDILVADDPESETPCTS